MREQIIELRNLGLSYKEISEKLNIGKSLVSFHLRKMKMNQPIENKGLKINDSLISEIKKLNTEGVPKKEISEKLNVSFSTIKKYTGKNEKIKLSKEEAKIKLYNKHKNWRLSIKIKAIDYLGGKCVNCGYKNCIAALDLHHKGDEKKEFTISGGNLKSFEKLKSELDKCILLCSNCHREHHNPHLIGLI